ncbi:MAG: hypothetical protein HZA49_02650 [Planctomycetes bacterium]|nr:hypothetical protein [Planctomycetota bacterium]
MNPVRSEHERENSILTRSDSSLLDASNGVSKKLLFGLPLLIIGLFAAISLTWLESADNPKSYSLKYLMKEGDKEVIIYKLEATANVKVPSMPTHPGMPLYSKLQQEIEQKILKITDGQVTRLERNYRSSKYFVSKSSQTPKAEPLDTKKIIIDSDGTITPVGQGPTNQITDSIKAFISIDEHRFAPILPAEEVQAKSEWEVPSESVPRIFNFSNHKRRTVSHGCTEVCINARFNSGSLKCLLKEVKSDNAVIELNGTLKGEDNGMNLEATIKGTATFAIKKGRFTKVEISGDITLDGNQPCTKGNTMGQATGEGKINISYEFK